jgi:hypothetical protein
VAVVTTARHRLARIAGFVLAPGVTRYINTQRDRLAKDAVPVAPHFINEAERYFEPGTLESARIAASTCLRLPQFPYAPALRRVGFSFPDPQLVAAITFDHLIAVREAEPCSSLLFHELVHVVQYRLLGTATFARLYVQGFLETGSYEEIPLERCAWTLEERFARGGAPFSVESAVASWLQADGYRATIRTGPNNPDSIGS